jgi:hypothetical protein
MSALFVEDLWADTVRRFGQIFRNYILVLPLLRFTESLIRMVYIVHSATFTMFGRL